MPKIVISGVNLVEGGILTILQDCMAAFKKIASTNDLELIVLVHSKSLVKDYLNQDNITILEYPKIKSSWTRRLYFEFIYSKKLSNKIKPDIWFSLHDITPNVNCKFQVVYCHNPSPFYTLEKKYYFLDTTFLLFNMFYKYLYNVNIKKNTYIIIQQNWLRDAFKKMYGVNTIVAYPIQQNPNINTEAINLNYLNINFNYPTFFYPSIPRVFKNFEVIGEAAQILESQNKHFEIILTLNGLENKYSKEIFEKYKHVKNLKFIGIQKRNVIEALYNKVDCLIFPSKLETWGLPLSEFKLFDKPIIVADLPYAHENIGTYDKVAFFNQSDATKLAGLIINFIENKLIFDKPKPVTPAFPFFDNWENLLNFLIIEAKKNDQQHA
jgi:glycosyltransferase involved in cell wall biosynthesis